MQQMPVEGHLYNVYILVRACSRLLLCYILYIQYSQLQVPLASSKTQFLLITRL